MNSPFHYLRYALTPRDRRLLFGSGVLGFRRGSSPVTSIGGRNRIRKDGSEYGKLRRIAKEFVDGKFSGQRPCDVAHAYNLKEDSLRASIYFVRQERGLSGRAVTPGKKLFDHLSRVRANNMGKLDEAKWVAAADDFLSVEFPANLFGAKETVKHKGTRKEREILFDALCKACSLKREGMTAPMKRTVAVSLSTILAVMPTLTAEEVELRAKEYRRKHGTWELTPSSLAKHWGSLATASSIQGILDEPQGWRERYADIFPEEESGATGEYISRQFWPKIPSNYQARIYRHMATIAAANKEAKT